MERMISKLIKIFVSSLVLLTVIVASLTINFHLIFIQGIIIEILFLLILISLCSVYHHFRLKKEKNLIVPNGKMVKVNEHKIHVYVEGEKSNKPAIVIMPMSCIPVPVYDYKILYSKLCDKYRVIVVEKAGYGYSEIAGGSRSVDVMVKEARSALESAGENGPYVLMPASYSGIEALYWAQTYPDEIRAIVGLDMANPEEFFSMNIFASVMQGKILNKLAFLGVLRASFELNKEYDLSEEEAKQYFYLANAKMFNKDMMEESKAALDNAKKVNLNEVPKVPLLLFTTDESTGIKGWRGIQYAFARRFENAKVIDLDCKHEVHCYKSDYIAEKTKEFLNGILDKINQPDSYSKNGYR